MSLKVDSFETPLTLAAGAGHIEFAQLMLDNGSCIEESNIHGLAGFHVNIYPKRSLCKVLMQFALVYGWRCSKHVEFVSAAVRSLN